MIDYSIVIDCPDSYLDILKIFFIFLERNWKTRKQMIYVTTQEMDIDCPNNVKFVKCGHGTNSIQRSKIALNLIEDKYVFVLDCDDFIGKKVNDLEINSLLEFAEQNSINYIRVWQTKNIEQKKYKTSFKKMFYCNKKARYSKSLMANFWNKDEYINVFKNDNNDGWSVEKEWLKEAKIEKPGFYIDYCYYASNPFGIIHAVSKGKWIRNAYRKMRKAGINKEALSKREKMSIKDNFKFVVSSFFRRVFPSSFCYFLKAKTSKKINYTSEY